MMLENIRNSHNCDFFILFKNLFLGYVKWRIFIQMFFFSLDFINMPLRLFRLLLSIYWTI